MGQKRGSGWGEDSYSIFISVLRVGRGLQEAVDAPFLFLATLFASPNPRDIGFITSFLWFGMEEGEMHAPYQPQFSTDRGLILHVLVLFSDIYLIDIVKCDF
ncbi:hypothetical protein CDAR_527471 [Caerostris darwini]|uniref:Uncharacterized protein n=1 Tax=Caerostris darwini TaxID=1538125 RepID=A0AAV4WNC2_9ARAC|nr:hypothetical protein CDAR_527471 [Caerostris darwini]